MKTLKKQDQAFLLALGLIGAACLGAWTPGPFVIRLASAMLLAFFLPGWLLLHALAYAATDKLDRLVIAVGASYGLSLVATLGLLYAAGALSQAGVVVCLGLLSLLLAGVARFRSSAAAETQPLTVSGAVFFLLPVSVAAFLSLANLGYSDYLGDEMNGLLRAISIIYGRPETLFEHTKGPAEVLLPALFGLLAGRFEPFTLRLPFALAHIAGVGGFYLLGRRLFDRRVGLLAAVLVAINGLYLAFGRIIQYQAVVFLMMALAALLAYRFYRSGDGKALGLGAFLAAVGLLAHYDMLLLLPALAYLVWARFGWRWRAWRAAWRPLALALAILLGVTGLFYLPFLLHPSLGRTSSYLGRVVGASNWPGNNFDELYVFTVMYNSRYYAVFIALLGGGLVLADLARLLRPAGRSRRLWLSLVGFAALSLAATLLGRSAFVPLLFSGLLFLWLIGLAPLPVERKMVYTWLGAAFIGYVFFVDRPRTHLQIIYLPWSLLVALALAGIGAALAGRFAGPRRQWVMAGAGAVLAVLLALFSAYEYLLFADADKEYIFTYPRHRQSWYWEDPDFPFGSRRLYGAPHRLGWQTIQQLYLSDVLEGDWGSNDEGTNLYWYTLGAANSPCYPRYYFLTQFRQKGGQETGQAPSADYVKVGQVWNRDRLQMDVYEFAPLQPVEQIVVWSEPSHYNTYSVPADFRSLPYENSAPVISQPLPVPATFSLSPAALQTVADQYGDPRIAAIRDRVALIGYDLDDRRAAPGGLIVLTLYWQPVEGVNLPYKIFTHLLSQPGPGQEPQLWAQSDDFPACGTRSSQQWRPGEIITDRHVIKLPGDAPSGGYKLVVGLYEPQTGLRMDVLDVMGNPQGNSFELAPVRVQDDD